MNRRRRQNTNSDAELQNEDNRSLFDQFYEAEAKIDAIVAKVHEMQRRFFNFVDRIPYCYRAIISTSVLAFTILFFFYIMIEDHVCPVFPDSNYCITQVKQAVRQLRGSSVPVNEELLHVIHKWASRTSALPQLVVVAGSSKATSAALASMAGTLSTLGGRPLTPVYNLTSTSSRAEIDRFYKQYLDISTSTNVFGYPMAHQMVVFNGIQELGWDAPIALHSFGEETAAPALVIVGVFRDKTGEEIDIDGSILPAEADFGDENSCEENVVEFLVKKWSANGALPEAIHPIVSGRFGLYICL